RAQYNSKMSARTRGRAMLGYVLRKRQVSFLPLQIATSADGTISAFDTTSLEVLLSSLNRQDQRELLRRLLDDFDTLALDLESASCKADLRKIAHRVNGLAATIGAQELAQDAERLEQSVSRRATRINERLLDRVRSHLDTILTVLSDMQPAAPRPA
ncbi:MAG: Hpt domain-containing protein, partial [Pseudomonadota bacterium]